MSSSSSAPAGHEKYYVPESSSLAVRATIGLILSVFGAAMAVSYTHLTLPTTPYV